MIGREIQQYRIVDKIGEGGMGAVFRAEDTRLKRLVALKAISAHLSKDEEAQERFLREAQAASSLNHPNIATIHDLLEEGEERFIVMEYVEGKTIRNMVEDGRVSTKKAVDLLLQAAEALEAAHNKGILHRDIKSANIMVTLDGRAKVMDFGLAQLEEKSQLTRTGTTLGTLAYSSPEQISGRPVDRRSELFSLGVVFYELLTGRLPFKGSSEAEVVFSIINNEPPRLTELREEASELLEAVVSRMLEKDPDLRYASCGDLITDLKALKSGVETSTVPIRGAITASLPTAAAAESAARAASRAVPSVTGIRSPRPWLYGIGAVAIVAVIVITVLLMRRPAAPAGPVPFAGSTRQVTFSGTAEQPAISPDGEWLAFVDEGRLLLQDLSGGGQPIELAPGIPSPNQITWHPDGTSLYFVSGKSETNDLLGDLYRVPRLGGQPRMLYRDLFTYALHPDGSRAIIGDRLFEAGADTVKLLELGTQRVLRRLGLGGAGALLTIPVWSPDGDRLIAVSVSLESSPGSMWRIASPDGVVSEEWADPTGELPLMWADDASGYSLLSRGESRILRFQAIDPGTGRRAGEPVEVLTNLPEGFDLGSVSREGKVAVYRTGRTTAAVEAMELTGRDLEPSAPRPLTTGTAVVSSARISPDGDWVLYVKETGSGEEIFMRPFSDGEERQVTSGTSGEINGASWAPDAAQIAFAVMPEGEKSPGIYIVGREGGLPRQIRAPSGQAMTANLGGWTPDGQHLLISSLSSIEIVDLMGRSTASYPIPDSLGIPAWIWFSPEEGKVGLMTANLEQGIEQLARIATMDLTSGEISSVSRIRGFLNFNGLDWSPDGQSYWVRPLPEIPGQTQQGGELVRMPMTGGQIQRLAVLPWKPNTISFSRDLRRAVGINNSGTFDLWIATGWFPE